MVMPQVKLHSLTVLIGNIEAIILARIDSASRIKIQSRSLSGTGTCLRNQIPQCVYYFYPQHRHGCPGIRQQTEGRGTPRLRCRFFPMKGGMSHFSPLDVFIGCFYAINGHGVGAGVPPPTMTGGPSYNQTP